ncbi:hypothetical protein CONCODRAFT_70114 [Conidiobolus coronatus NRRL 28638]|uniref:Uncharacterized protein n=1 Tax=Conidiobolus coronatus (strain ATCC 28846 / CBS 209.66 / NRRL 28638) TaxID=796925 RepID=A0A137P7X4_CONC2|nr:hypothetical protein CONCODRAFT_70114 [Conidiobolus coronatus NRRL 28638]|eukprot:KXN71106.1 hypothetical protein CONCODRAFT_70114 [Conidiobolus coronatus NRRL 28638]
MSDDYLEYYNEDQIDSFTEYSDNSYSHKDYTGKTTYLADRASEGIDLSETDNYSDNFLQNNQDDINTENQFNAGLGNMQPINEAEHYMLYSHATPQLYNNGFEDDNYISSILYADDIFYFDDSILEDNDYISPELRPMTPSSQY